MPRLSVPLKKRKIRGCIGFTEVPYNFEEFSSSCDSVSSSFSLEATEKEHAYQEYNIKPSHNQKVAFSHENLWDTRFNELLEFKRKHGHCNVPQRYGHNKALGKWVHHNKQLMKNQGGIMRPDRYEALQKIQFMKKALTKAEIFWYRRYDELVEFRQKNGHCNVPQRYFHNIALGKWVHRQRHSLKQKSKRMTPERVKALKAIHFIGFP